MKKLVSLLLVFLLCFGASAAADGLDLSAMSTDDLLILRNQITAEISARLTDDSAMITDGLYVVGVDIKTGMYRIACASDDYIDVMLFDSKENYQTYQKNTYANVTYRLYRVTLSRGEMATVHLTDGMVLEISDGIGVITEIVKPSWAP